MFKPNKYYQQNMQIDHHIVKKTIETRLGGILRHIPLVLVPLLDHDI
jgi:hypothetical protein